MNMNMKWKICAALLVLASVLAFGAERFGKPQSVIHVVTLAYKPEATAEQKAAVLSGIQKMAAEIPGIKNVWLKSFKVQGQYLPSGGAKPIPMTDAFVMEFESQAAFEKYGDHPAHRAWEKIYLPVRAGSVTHDITN